MKPREPLYTRYVSAIDRLLQKYDKNHPQPSLSQQQEQEKYKKVFHKRDVENRNETNSTMWDEF